MGQQTPKYALRYYSQIDEKFVFESIHLIICIRSNILLENRKKTKQLFIAQLFFLEKTVIF